VIGEMGCVLGEPRSATIRALRTSELIAVSRDALEQLARSHPAVLLSLYRTLVGRLRNVQEGRLVRHRPRTFCLLPNVVDDDARAFTRDFAAALGHIGDRTASSQAGIRRLHLRPVRQIEAAHEVIVYVAERAKSPWSRLC
jgi:NTE family protein